MKINFRKIASVLASTAMLSSTLALAAAANYPAPFVQNGNADAAIVYGSLPGADLDLLAVVQISQNLQNKLAAQTATPGTPTTSSVSGGDYIVLSKSSDRVNLGNSVNDVFGETLTSSDLKDLLVKGKYLNDENTEYDYDQRISLGTVDTLVYNYFADSDYNDRTPSLGFNLTTSQVVMNYSLDFLTDAESDISGGDLIDLETTTIKILGKEYYISDFDNATNPVITLLDTANSAVVTEGEASSVTVGAKTYDVSISFVDSTSTRLSVNGEITNSLAEGGTYKLSDGTYVGIKDILYNSKDAAVSKVEFSLGSGKLELKDGNAIEMNDDSVQEIKAEVRRGSETSSKGKIDRINLVWTTQDDEFVTESQDLVMPGFNSIKLSLSEMSTAGDEVTTISDGASDYIQLKTTIKGGDVTIPLLYGNAEGNFSGIGKGTSERLVTNVNTSDVSFNYTKGDRHFIASWNSSNSAESYYLRYVDFENDNGINRTTIESYEGGSWTKRCEDLAPSGTNTCTLGSLTLTIGAISAYPDRAVNMSVNAGGSFNKLYTKNGLEIRMPWSNTSYASPIAIDALASLPGVILFNNASSTTQMHNIDTYALVFYAEDRNGNLAAGNAFNVTFNDNSDNELEVSDISTNREEFTDPKDSNHVSSRVYNDQGVLVELEGQSSDQREATVTYSAGEIYGDLILTTKDATVSGSTSTSGGTVKELGDIVVKDSEVASVSTKNLIVVGGSCVNTLAKELLGGAGCGSDFEQKTGVGAGSFLIQSFSRTGGKVATLVAGYNAADTVAGARVFTTQVVDTSAGKKYKGTGSTVAAVDTTATTA